MKGKRHVEVLFAVLDERLSRAKRGTYIRAVLLAKEAIT